MTLEAFFARRLARKVTAGRLTVSEIQAAAVLAGAVTTAAFDQARQALNDLEAANDQQAGGR